MRPDARPGAEPTLTASAPLPISRPSLPRRLMVRLRTLTPSIVVRIHAGHPSLRRTDKNRLTLRVREGPIEA
jgi:hypothetical protein